MSQHALSLTEPLADTVRPLQEAVLLHKQGRLWEAEQLLDGLLKQDDRHFGALYHLGLIRLHQRRYPDAASLFRRAARINKHSAEAQHQLAIALTGLERFEAAVSHYEKALAIDPRSPEVHNNMGYVLERLGRSEEAISHYEKALALAPEYPEARNNLGNALQQLQRYEDAIGQYREALALRPSYADAYGNLANALAKLAYHEEALPHYQKAIALRPRYAIFRASLGNALAALERHEEALAQYQIALADAPEDPDVHASLGSLLFNMGRAEDSLAHCEKAIAIRPDHAGGYLHRGVALRALGRLAEAIKDFESAIRFAPKSAGSYHALVTSTRLTTRSPHFLAMAELARNVTELDPEDQISLHFAMAKVLSDSGEQQKSFQHLLKGNALKRRRFHYDEPATMAHFARVASAFSSELLRRKVGLGDHSRVPVFILGMPRSGTTLVEQILASHPKVFGAGELRHFGKLVQTLRSGSELQWPALISDVSSEKLRQLGETYVQTVRELAPQAERITDKMPGNFVHAGFIHLALPNARIIHTRRDPSDNALSCFSLLFAEGQQFTYDLAELGRYYAAYERLMEHWRRVLPEGVMLEVQYEDVVDDLEMQARRIIAHCGLEWDEACLSFHETKRTVRTASVVQVRQPIYRTSVGRGEGHRELMRPFLDALEHARTQVQ